MSIDVEGLRSTIRSIRHQIDKQQIVGLDDDVARLQEIADAADVESPNSSDSDTPGLDLPPEIVVPHPAAVLGYVRAHPAIRDLVRGMATALAEEFSGERSEIELDLYQDPEIDDRYLTLIIRLPEYDASLMPRLKGVAKRFDDRRAVTDGWLLVTSDYQPIE